MKTITAVALLLFMSSFTHARNISGTTILTCSAAQTPFTMTYKVQKGQISSATLKVRGRTIYAYDKKKSSIWHGVSSYTNPIVKAKQRIFHGSLRFNAPAERDHARVSFFLNEVVKPGQSPARLFRDQSRQVVTSATVKIAGQWVSFKGLCKLSYK